MLAKREKLGIRFRQGVINREDRAVVKYICGNLAAPGKRLVSRVS